MMNNKTTTPSPSVVAVQSLLGYTFEKKALLEAALTHPSCMVTVSYQRSESYQRLEFLGDAALSLAVANFLRKDPDINEGQLTKVRSANTSSEKFARVAVRHGLYNYMRRNCPALDDDVREFSSSIEDEGDEVIWYGTKVAAPKVLADLVESVAAAVYLDSGLNLERMWKCLYPLLKPIVTPENIQHHPVTVITELCQKDGKKLEFIRSWNKETKIAFKVFVDGRFVGQGFSKKKGIAKLIAAKEALQTMTASMNIHGGLGIRKGAKQKLNEYCDKKRWPKPTYRIEKERGPPHDKKFISSVHIKWTSEVYRKEGDQKGRVKDAENSAAAMMLQELMTPEFDLNDYDF